MSLVTGLHLPSTMLIIANHTSTLVMDIGKVVTYSAPETFGSIAVSRINHPRIFGGHSHFFLDTIDHWSHQWRNGVRINYRYCRHSCDVWFHITFLTLRPLDRCVYRSKSWTSVHCDSRSECQPYKSDQ